MKVKDLIIRLLDEPMNAEIMLCTDYDKEVEDYDVRVVNRGVIFDINEIEHWNNRVTINFTDWRKDDKLSEETPTNTSTKSTNISTDASADRPRGYWIGDKCSVCGEERAWYGSNPPICPDCGADMRGEDE